MVVARGSSTSSAAWLILAMAGGLGLSAEAAAGERGDRCQRNLSCRVHSDKGVAASEKKNYAEALAEFQAAYAAEPSSRLLLNIGRSLYRLDRPQEALDYYARYRKEETSMDVEAEKTLRKYEIDALMASAVLDSTEPPPAPLSVPPRRWPPPAVLALLGSSVGLFIIGIGLGAGAVNAGKDLGQPGNNLMMFGPDAQAIETRGLNMQASGIAFDVLGLITLSAGAASLGTWLHMRSAPQSTNVAQARAPRIGLLPISGAAWGSAQAGAGR